MLLPYHTPQLIEAGTDEAGRGCLAGPVYAAAVILPPDYHNTRLNDSKQLTERQRYALREEIIHDALAWAIGVCTAQEIDQLNILRASITAMHRALNALTLRPQHIIVDGNRFYPYIPSESKSEPESKSESKSMPKSKSESEPESKSESKSEPRPIPHHTIVKGDGKYLSIAAASILAKTFRDDEMLRLDLEYPQFGWKQNKGYPSPAHRQAIAQYGPTPYHRMTFRLLPDAEQLELDLK